ncbi:tricalbin [Coniochaeta ligniaria NRRL 30616]|uniref:Tricalbin n=1 Tax=Coniochaeta ligniaria NRRL 30616 TaxID=1408157 RepID=A0A1J7JYQ4_9PEZI|nr:tricalbin [Coniochaeta ligniaria NRRL 30616]
MSTERSAGELKTQGVIEAADDPNSSVTSGDAQKKIVEESKNAGIQAFSFDPNASAEQKKAQVKAAIPEGFHSNRVKGVAIATDIDDGTQPTVDLPPPSKAGAIEIKDEAGINGQNGYGPGDKETVMGPDTTGWEPRFGWPTEPIEEGDSMQDHTTWLESNLADHLYGDWYHNAGIIIFACLSTWLIGILGGGLAWVFLIMAVCSTYYRTSIRRVRRNFRDDITRELSLKKIETDTESLEWINAFLVKFWPIYQPVLAKTVINSVDQVLSSATPAFLDSLKLRTFTLGSKPPRMEHVRTYPKAEDDIVMMDWKFSFNPNDTADMTARQIKNKINPKVVLEIRIGKAMISKGLDIIVEDMAFSGIMRLKIKLQIPFPHVEKIEMCFLERPTIDYVCKPLGGETFGFDINFIPGLESFIQEQIHGNLAPMMYAPNVFPIEVAKMLAGTPVDQAIGVVAITLHGAQGLKTPDSFSGTCDPYAVVTLNRRQPLAQTKVVKDTSNPRWSETHYVIVTSFNDSLDIQIFDFNDFRKDKEMGCASFLLENFEEINEYENERLDVISDGKIRGVLSCDLRFFPVLEPQKSADGKVVPPPETNTGILRFTVEQAKDLDGTKSLVGMLNPYAILTLNNKEIHTTDKLKRTNNPIWERGSKEILITDRRSAKLGVVIRDDRDIAGDQTIGKYQIKLDDMLELMAKGQEWYNLAGAKTGRVKMQAQWKPVAISGVIAGTGGYITPIGVMRLHFKNARDLRNFETMGKSDSYVRVLLSGLERARTVTFKNNLNPDWDEVLYVPVHSPRERLQLEVMDAEKVGRDRSLGLVELFAGDFIAQDENGEYLVNDVKAPREDGLKLHGKGIAKGTLNYTVAFYPTLNIADPEDEEEEKQKEQEKDAAHSDPKKSLDVPRSADGGRPSLDSHNEKEPLTPITPRTPLTPSSPGFPRKSRDEKRPPKVHLTPQELLTYDSGLVIFKLMEAELPKSNTRIEIFVDDMAFPSYVSSTAKNRTHKFDEIGDCFIRELEFSKLTLKVREKNEKQEENGDKEHTLARLTGNTFDTLKQCLNNPTVLKMKDDEGKISSVKVSLKYIPVKMQLDPSESINNMGNLRVDVLDAESLPSADSNGKSDPYVKFELNGEDVFKTKTQKKTLHPAWNEFFEVTIPSRTAAKFRATVWDWDFADKPDYLGGADIRLDQLEPFKAQEIKLKLDGKSGMLRLRLLFRPDYVTRSRHGTSTFSGTFAVPGRIVTGVAGAPIKGGVAVAGVVGHGMGKGASFIKRGFTGKKDKDLNGSTPMGTITDVPTITTNGSDLSAGSGLKRDHSRKKSMGASSVHSAMVPGAGSGVATFTVVSASGFPPSSDVYVVVHQVRDGKTKTVGKTKHHKSPTGEVKFDETFKISCTPDSLFKIDVKGNHKFGSDDDLGEASYAIDETNSGQEKEVKVGNGSVVLRSSFTPAESHLSASSDSPKNVRRSFLSRRDARPPTREGTPS